MSVNAKIRVLVVEDEESIRRGLCDVLAYRGYAPEGVERGDEGLRRGLSREHALVLLDVMLPGMNGFDVCRELRGALPQLPILMLTARGAEQDVLDGFRAGADDYVTKPFSVAELLARVEALLAPLGRARRATRTRRRSRSARGRSTARRAPRGAARRASSSPRSRPRSRRCSRASRGGSCRGAGCSREVWDDRQPRADRDAHRRHARGQAAQEARRAPALALIQTVRGEGYRFSA